MLTYFNTAEVAEYLRLSERTVYELVRTRQIPCARVSGRWLFPRALIDQWVATQTVTAGILPAPPPAIVAGSHDPLLDWAIREAGLDLAVMTCGSREGLRRMLDGRAAIAAAHLSRDPDRGDDAVPLDAGAVGAQVVVVEWARRDQGLVVKPGNPLHLGGLADLVPSSARLIHRQPGAGAEALLKRLLSEAGIDPTTVVDAAQIARTETEVGEMVADNVGDCGLAIRAVAERMKLGFVPLAVERFDLAMQQATYFAPFTQALLALSRTPEFVRQAGALGGYDLSRTGRIVVAPGSATHPNV